MSTIGGSRALYSALKGVKDDINAAFIPAADRARTILLQAASPDGTIDPRRKDDVQAAVGDVIMRLFVGPNLRSAFGQDGVTPLSPYAELLNKWLVQVQYDVVKAHSTYLRRVLRDHPDIIRWLANATVREISFTPRQRQGAEERLTRLGVPFDAGADDDTIAAQLRSAVFRPNPLAVYEPAHTWVSSEGYRLSDRIWANGTRTRLKIDALLADGIAQGRGAVSIADELEQFLLPSRADLRTNKPYGKSGSSDALRLARTEITRAHAQASLTAMQSNPFVQFADYALSTSHPRYDVCDTLASIGMGGQRLREPYPLDQLPMPVRDTHPSCLCHTRAFVDGNVSDLIATLRDQMNRGEPAPFTPLNPFTFLTRLVGSILARLAPSFGF